MRAIILFGAALLAASFSLPAFAQERESACRPLQYGEAETGSARGRQQNAGQVWASANGAARQRPERGGFEAARYVYTYAAGALYELDANPNFISTILLEEGKRCRMWPPATPRAGS